MIPGGRDIPVTETNVYDYVRKYAECRMIKVQEKALDVSINSFFLIFILNYMLHLIFMEKHIDILHN